MKWWKLTINFPARGKAPSSPMKSDDFELTFPELVRLGTYLELDSAPLILTHGSDHGWGCERQALDLKKRVEI